MNLFMDNEILFVDAKSRINVCRGGDELNLVGMEIAKQNKTLRAIKQIITQKEYISFYTICYMNVTLLCGLFILLVPRGLHVVLRDIHNVSIFVVKSNQHSCVCGYVMKAYFKKSCDLWFFPLSLIFYSWVYLKFSLPALKLSPKGFDILTSISTTVGKTFQFRRLSTEEVKFSFYSMNRNSCASQVLMFNTF